MQHRLIVSRDLRGFLMGYVCNAQALANGEECCAAQTFFAGKLSGGDLTPPHTLGINVGGTRGLYRVRWRISISETELPRNGLQGGIFTKEK